MSTPPTHLENIMRKKGERIKKPEGGEGSCDMTWL